MNTIRILNKLNNLNPIKMNQELKTREMNVAEMMSRPITDSEAESKERSEKRRRIEILKNWEIRILPLDRGCTVFVGCKSFAFESLDVAMETVKQYVDNPAAVIKRFGFEDHI